jgi:hypothetical protein
VTGTVGGRALVVNDVVALVGSLADGGTEREVLVDIASVHGACARLVRVPDASVPNETVLTVGVATLGSAIGPGTYSTATSLPSLQATFKSSDSSCAATLTDATSGTLTLTTVSASLVAGDFDLFFGTSGRLTGNFMAPVCGVNPFDIPVSDAGLPCGP